MPRLLVMLCVLTSSVALSACATSGQPIVLPQLQCKLPPVSASLMQEPHYEQQVRDVLFNSVPSATPTSADSSKP